jgi:hypothetical protein
MCVDDRKRKEEEREMEEETKSSKARHMQLRQKGSFAEVRGRQR